MIDTWRVEKIFCVGVVSAENSRSRASVRFIQDFPFGRAETWILEAAQDNTAQDVAEIIREDQISLGEIFPALISLIESRTDPAKPALTIQVNLARKWPHADNLFSAIATLCAMADKLRKSVS